MHGAPTTWTTLLAHWTGVAQRALALPRTPEGDRLRAAVPHLIGLQAVSLALDHLDQLPADERALGLDRAEIAIRDHGGAVRQIFAEVSMPDAVTATLREAASAIQAARSAGLGWVVATDALTVEHPGALIAALLEAGFSGDLMLPTPGTVLFRASPCAFAREPHDRSIDDALLAIIGLYLGQKQRLVRGPSRMRPFQVYRQFDFARGGPVRDLVVPQDAPDVAGQPQLLWAIRGGQAQPVPLPGRHQPPTGSLPVEFDMP